MQPHFGSPTGRVFIAAHLPESIRGSLAKTAKSLEATFPGRYTDPAGYHVTLAFIGVVPLQEAVPVLSKCLSDALSGEKSIEATVSGLGTYGHPDSAILWAGIQNANRPIHELALKVRRALDTADYNYDTKDARAHITLARRVNIEGANLPDIPAASGLITAVSLFHSTRERGKLEYIPLATVPLT